MDIGMETEKEMQIKEAVAHARALFLTSRLSGTVRGPEVRFVKTCDGSGVVSHSVEHRGTLDANGRRVRGSFTA